MSLPFLFPACSILLDHIHPASQLSECLPLPVVQRARLAQGKDDLPQLLRRVSSSPKDCNKKFSVFVMTAV